MIITRTETKGSSFEGKRTWTEAVEHTNVNGYDYARSSSYDFHYEDGTIYLGGDDTALQHFRIENDSAPPEVPEVVCGKCSGTTFTIHFGSYSVHARCTTVGCGMSAEVYSG